MKAVLNCEKMNSTTCITKLSNHIFRKEICLNVDKNRSWLNEELVIPDTFEKDLNSFVQKRIEEIEPYQTRKIRKDAVKGFAIVMSYGQNNESEKIDLDKWKEASVKFLQDFFGKENVGAAVLHMDETTPHIHAFVTPIVNNHFNSKSYHGWKGSISFWHDEYYKYIKDIGFDEPIHGTRAKRESLDHFYSLITASEKDKLPEIKEGETAEEYRERAQEYHSSSVAAYKYNDEKAVKLRTRMDLMEKINRDLLANNRILKEEIEREKQRVLLAERKVEKKIEEKAGMTIYEIEDYARSAKLLEAAIRYALKQDRLREDARTFVEKRDYLWETYSEEILEKETVMEHEEK